MLGLGHIKKHGDKVLRRGAQVNPITSALAGAFMDRKSVDPVKRLEDCELAIVNLQSDAEEDERTIKDLQAQVAALKEKLGGAGDVALGPLGTKVEEIEFSPNRIDDVGTTIPDISYHSQRDPRWIDFELAPGKRVGDQGCLLCCLSMFASHLAASEITPVAAYDELLRAGAFDGEVAWLKNWAGAISFLYSASGTTFTYKTLRKDDLRKISTDGVQVFPPAAHHPRIYEVVRAELDAGRPCILRIDYGDRAPSKVNHHFVLAIGWSPDPELPGECNIHFHNPGRTKGNGYAAEDYSCLRSTQKPFVPVGVDWFEPA